MGQGNDVKYYLHDLKHVNTVLSMLYDENGKYRAGFSPEEFYNTILLDTLKFGEENYVHLKYAEVINIGRNQSVARFRRWAGMTPIIRPLVEGMPPAPDKTAIEYMEVGNVFSFGRWTEFTDAIDTSVVSDIIAERSNQYGENANQTKELYARKEWLSAPNEYFANFKNGFGDITFADKITLDDLRFLIARMKRAQVKPLAGKYNYICSPEFINGLIDDPRVKAYMSINQTTGNLWTSGEPFDLFELNFIPTMLDEFAYPDTEYPGVFETNDGHEIMRLYAYAAAGSLSGVTKDAIVYLDMRDDFAVKSGVTAKTVASGVSYLNDGTAVENKESWELPTDADNLSGHIVGTLSSISASNVCVRYQTVEAGTPDSYGHVAKVYGALTGGDSLTSTDIDSLIDDGKFMQLPIHRGILFGDEGMIKINKEGLSDNPQIIIKPLGSAGVNDALNQRQSVGYRVDGFGLAIKRPEAICVTYGIPENAEFAAVTAAYIGGSPTLLEYEGEYIEDEAGNRVQAMVVDGVNNPYDQAVGTAMVNALNKYKQLELGQAYAKGDFVQYLGVPYVVNSAINASDNEVSGYANTAAYAKGTMIKVSTTYYICTTAYTPTPSTGTFAAESSNWTKATIKETRAKAFDLVRSSIKKDADRLFANLFEISNASNSNVK